MRVRRSRSNLSSDAEGISAALCYSQPASGPSGEGIQPRLADRIVAALRREEMVKTAPPQAPVVFASSRVRVRVSADGSLYEGDVHLHGDARRIQEVLNDPRPFLNLTDVKILTEAGTEVAAYVALNKGAITHVVLLGDDSSVSPGVVSSMAVSGDATHPVLPATGNSPSAGGASEPIDELSVSDLLIEDDDDDGSDELDLEDFE